MAIITKKHAAEQQKFRDEIEELRKENQELAARNKHLENELSLAANLKLHLMQHVFPAFPEETSFDIYADQMLASGIGGDYYDFFRIDEDHIGFVVADICAGSSVSSLFMIVFKILNNSLSRLGIPLTEAVRVINEHLCQANEDDLSLSAWCGIYEISSGEVEAVNAGHEQAILIHGGEVSFLKEGAESYLLGIFPDMAFKSFRFTLAKGDKLLLYTDGAYRSDGRKDEKEAYKILNALRGQETHSPEETVGFLQKEMTGDMKAEEITEDSTFLCIERKG